MGFFKFAITVVTTKARVKCAEYYVLLFVLLRLVCFVICVAETGVFCYFCSRDWCVLLFVLKRLVFCYLCC